MALELKELKETSLPLASKSLLSINNYIEVDIKIPVYDPALTLVIYPNELKIYIYTHTCA